MKYQTVLPAAAVIERAWNAATKMFALRKSKPGLAQPL
jgi:hypothetical protein